MSDAAAPKQVQFGLKRSETNLLMFTKTHQDAIFSGLISTIAADRLAYPVSDRTQFKLSDDMTKVEISELPEVPEEQPGPPADPGGAVKTAA